MEKEIISQNYDVNTNTTTFYYSDNTFESVTGKYFTEADTTKEEVEVTEPTKEEVEVTEPTIEAEVPDIVIGEEGVSGVVVDEEGVAEEIIEEVKTETDNG